MERERKERELKQQQEQQKKAGNVEIEKLRKENAELQQMNNTLISERDKYKSGNVI